MFNRYGLDIEKTIFVIDSPATAFMVSILTEGAPAYIVLEQKEGLETDLGSKLILNFIYSCINISTLNIVKVPPRFFISSRNLKRIFEIKCATRQLYKNYPADVIFIGASTSTFIRSLTVTENRIYFLYHGMSDCIRMDKEREERCTVKGRIKNFFFGKLVGLPYSIWCNYWPKRAFSLCDLTGDVAKWIDLYDFRSKIVANQLDKLKLHSDKKNNVLFFPITGEHMVSGIDGNTIPFNAINLRFLIKHINPRLDRVFIKYHPWLYRTKSRLKSDFIDRLKEHGIEAYDVGTMIPNDIGGPLIPTEALCCYFHFDKLIAEDTSTIWYLAKDASIEKILDITFADDAKRRFLRHCYNEMQKKCDSESIHVFDD